MVFLLVRSDLYGQISHKRSGSWWAATLHPSWWRHMRTLPHHIHRFTAVPSIQTNLCNIYFHAWSSPVKQRRFVGFGWRSKHITYNVSRVYVLCKLEVEVHMLKTYRDYFPLRSICGQNVHFCWHFT